MTVDAVPVTVVVDADLGRTGRDPLIIACAIVEPLGDRGVRYGALIRPGLDRIEQAQAEEFIVTRIGRFIEHGPEPDGWGNEPDGVWRLWCRLTALPPLD